MRRWGAAAVAAAGLVACLGFTACAQRGDWAALAQRGDWSKPFGVDAVAPSEPLAGRADSIERVVIADAADVEGAVASAASSTEMAMVRGVWTGDRSRWYELLTIGDEPAFVEVTWNEPTDDAGGESSIGVAVAVGRAQLASPATRDRSAMLLDAISARLEALRGVGVAEAGAE